MTDMKISFELKLFEDTKDKEPLLNRLEIMFDDIRNTIPEEFYYFSDGVPYGSTIKVTFEHL